MDFEIFVYFFFIKALQRHLMLSQFVDGFSGYLEFFLSCCTLNGQNSIGFWPPECNSVMIWFIVLHSTTPILSVTIRSRFSLTV